MDFAALHEFENGTYRTSAPNQIMSANERQADIGRRFSATIWLPACAKQLLLSIDDAAIAQFRAATEGHALVLARAARARFNAAWALAETGASGPTGNRYGDPPGHTCLALVGTTEKAITLETGDDDRVATMYVFADAALKLLAEALA
jgi:nicotinamide-nucleotide amidase